MNYIDNTVYNGDAARIESVTGAWDPVPSPWIRVRAVPDNSDIISSNMDSVWSYTSDGDAYFRLDPPDSVEYNGSTWRIMKDERTALSFSNKNDVEFIVAEDNDKRGEDDSLCEFIESFASNEFRR